MRIDGISFNADWAKSKTEREFVEQHIRAFNDSTHAVGKMTRRDQIRFFKQAYQVLTGGINHGNDQPADSEV